MSITFLLRKKPLRRGNWLHMKGRFGYGWSDGRIDGQIWAEQAAEQRQSDQTRVVTLRVSVVVNDAVHVDADCTG